MSLSKLKKAHSKYKADYYIIVDRFISYLPYSAGYVYQGKECTNQLLPYF